MSFIATKQKILAVFFFENFSTNLIDFLCVEYKIVNRHHPLSVNSSV